MKLNKGFTILLIQFLIPLLIIGQEGYRITYRYTPMGMPFNLNSPRIWWTPLEDRLVFVDSLSMSFRLNNGVDPAKKKNVYGNKLVNHAIFYKGHPKAFYSLITWPKDKEPLLLSDSLNEEHWIFLNQTKYIKGYFCKAALLQSPYTDSVLVWYTTDILKPFGPLLYIGFPGVVLEVYDKRNRIHLTAVKIDKDDYQVLMPTGVRTVTRREMLSMKR